MEKNSFSSSLSQLGLDIDQAFFKQIQHISQPSAPKSRIKISVIGTGNVGMAIAQTILTQDLADEIALIDAKPEKLREEMLDLQHATAFLPRTKIFASVDYDVTAGSDLCIVTAGSDLCIVTAGACQNPGERELEFLNLFFFGEAKGIPSRSVDQVELAGAATTSTWPEEEEQRIGEEDDDLGFFFEEAKGIPSRSVDQVGCPYVGVPPPCGGPMKGCL